MYQALYHGLGIFNIQETRYVRKRTYCIRAEQKNCSTQIQVKKNARNIKHTKRRIKQTHKRPIRPNNFPIPKLPTNARIPNNNKNPQKLRRLLRTQHHIPTIKFPREKRLRKKRMEHEQRKTQKNVQPDKQRTKHAKFYRRIAKPNMPKNILTRQNRIDQPNFNTAINRHDYQKRQKHSNKPHSV